MGLAFVRRSDGTVETLDDRRGLPLGVLPDEQYDQRETVLAPGDALIVYSDGLVDARVDLDLTPHVLASQLHGATSALAMLDRLVTLLAPVQTPPDDMTLLVVYRKTGQG
jgi:sigma-B regulation protein RsbU (phosphoserine phosphatase)